MTPRHALTALAGPHRCRAVLDADGWPIISARLGRLEWHGAELAVHVERSGPLDGPGRRRGSRGLFPPEVLPATFCTARR